MCDVPALRFPEFIKSWECSILEKLSKKIGDGIHSTPSYDDNGTFYFINGNNLNGGKIVITSSTKRVSEKEAYKNNAENLEANSILMSINGTIGNVALYHNEPIMLGKSACYINSKDNIDKNYLFYYLQYPKTQLYFEAELTGTTIKNLSLQSIRKTKIYIPTIEEQHKISRFLQKIDERISTQNKIIEDLKKLKSAIVEMILCKQGGVLLKLGDVGSFIRGLTYSSEDIAEDINATTVIRANNLNYGNNVSKKDVVYVNKKPTEIQILRKGDIVICMANGSSSLVGKNSYYSFDDRQSTIGAFCGIYRSSQPLVKWLMQSQRYRRLVYQSLQGGNGAIANLNGDDILNMTFYVVEDKKSVSILSALVLIENSIAVNEKLQELYSMQKEYLLQHLFI